jgi:hypothetical protein
LNDNKTRIGNERLRITLSANTAMIMLYWDIGRVILQRQAKPPTHSKNHPPAPPVSRPAQGCAATGAHNPHGLRLRLLTGKVQQGVMGFGV